MERRKLVVQVCLIFVISSLVLPAWLEPASAAGSSKKWDTDTELDAGAFFSTARRLTGSKAFVELNDSLEWNQVDYDFIFSPRTLFGMSFDSTEAVAVIYGGMTSEYFIGPDVQPDSYVLSDTLHYDTAGDTWDITAAGTPATRYGLAMAYDAVHDRSMMFGGSGATYYNDLWSYDAMTGNWAQRTAQGAVGSPTGRVFHSMAYDSTNDKLVVFGGNDGSFIYADTWEYDYNTNLWSETTTNDPDGVIPSPRRFQSMTFDSNNNVVILYGGDTDGDVLTPGSTETWQYDVATDSWTQFSPPSSPNLWLGSAMTFDPVAGDVILYGGGDAFAPTNQTWRFNVGAVTWTRAANATSARAFHSMVYDDVNGKTYVFGGTASKYFLFSSNTYGDVLRYDSFLNSWTDLDPYQNIPPPMHSGSMDYDSFAGDVVLFGGYTSKGWSDRVWNYSSAADTWSLRPAATGSKPSIRFAQATAYAANKGEHIVVAGYDGNVADVGFLKDVWSYNLTSNTWTSKGPAGFSQGRAYPEMVYVPSTGKNVLFGGIRNTGSPSYLPLYLGDTYIYDPMANSWLDVTAMDPTKPSGRYGHTMVYDSDHDLVLLFGGYDASGYRSDVWTFNPVTYQWNQQIPVGNLPSGVQLHGMVFNSVKGRAVIYGGKTAAGYSDLTYNYTYNSTGGYFSNPTFSVAPDPVMGHSMAFDPRTETIVHHGGTALTYTISGTWELVSLYPNAGTYTTDMLDAGMTVALWGQVTWNGTVSSPTTGITLQIASNNNAATWNYVGPDGTPSTFYNAASDVPMQISTHHNGNRYMKIRAYLNTADQYTTPRLNWINAEYNRANSPTLVSPVGGAVVYSGTPRFAWSFSDPDTDTQDAFNVLVDDEATMAAPSLCNSTDVVSTANTWDYAGCTSLPDGTYFWSARTRDSGGAWSDWAAAQSFVVDTSPTSLLVGNPNHTASGTKYFGPTTPFTLSAQGSSSSWSRVWNGTNGWGAPSQYSGPFTVSGLDGTRYVEFNSTDLFGNPESPQNYTATEQLYLDGSKPVTAIQIGTPNHTAGGTTYFSTATQFTLSAGDGAGSGVATTWYRVWKPVTGWGVLQQYSGPFPISGTSGPRYIEYNSTDNVRNSETPNNYTLTNLYLDNTNPMISSTIPSSGAAGVLVGQSVVITFDEEMNTTSFAFTCAPDPGGWSWVWSLGNTTVTGAHTDFTATTSYTFTVTSASDLLGNALTTNILVPNPWTWTTESGTAPPTILSTNPANSAGGVGLGQGVSITFSKPINTGTFSYTIFPDPGGWSWVWSNGDTVATGSHTLFAPLTLYTFTVTAAEDLSGNALTTGTAPNPWTWTTVSASAPPVIVSTVPYMNEVNVGINQNVIITFSKQIDTGTFAYTCTPDPGGWTWVWSDSDTKVTGSHGEFNTAASYTFDVTSADDLAGNSLTGSSTPNPWSWSTTLDPTPPTIISTLPANAATSVPVNQAVVITFSEPINSATFGYQVPPDPLVWNIAWSAGFTVATLTHTNFNYSSTYAFEVTAAKDNNGNSLAPGSVQNPFWWKTEDAPVDKGDITGRVVNESGGALPDAIVKLENATTGTVLGIASANDTGRFQFVSVPFGSYRLNVSLQGYVSNATATASLSSSSTSEDAGDIQLAPVPPPTSGSIAGRIQDPKGKGIPGANVTLVNSDGIPVDWTVTDSTGNFTFPDVGFGEYTVKAVMTDYESSTSQAFVLDEDNPTSTLTLALSPAAEPERPEGLLPEWMWIILMFVLVIVIILVAALLVAARRSRRGAEAAPVVIQRSQAPEPVEEGEAPPPEPEGEPGIPEEEYVAEEDQAPPPPDE